MTGFTESFLPCKQKSQRASLVNAKSASQCTSHAREFVVYDALFADVNGGPHRSGGSSRVSQATCSREMTILTPPPRYRRNRVFALTGRKRPVICACGVDDFASLFAHAATHASSSFAAFDIALSIQLAGKAETGAEGEQPDRGTRENQLATIRKSNLRAGRKVNERACNGIRPAPQVLRRIRACWRVHVSLAALPRWRRCRSSSSSSSPRRHALPHRHQPQAHRLARAG